MLRVPCRTTQRGGGAGWFSQHMSVNPSVFDHDCHAWIATRGPSANGSLVVPFGHLHARTPSTLSSSIHPTGGTRTHLQGT